MAISIDTEITRVVFRVFKAGNDVLALFPDQQNPVTGLVMSYQHIGQHSEANYYGCVKASRLATVREYIPLKRELQSLGYKVKVSKRK